MTKEQEELIILRVLYFIDGMIFGARCMEIVEEVDERLTKIRACIAELDTVDDIRAYISGVTVFATADAAPEIQQLLNFIDSNKTVNDRNSFEPTLPQCPTSTQSIGAYPFTAPYDPTTTLPVRYGPNIALTTAREVKTNEQ